MKTCEESALIIAQRMVNAGWIPRFGDFAVSILSDEIRQVRQEMRDECEEVIKIMRSDDDDGGDMMDKAVALVAIRSIRIK